MTSRSLEHIPMICWCFIFKNWMWEEFVSVWSVISMNFWMFMHFSIFSMLILANNPIADGKMIKNRFHHSIRNDRIAHTQNHNADRFSFVLTFLRSILVQISKKKQFGSTSLHFAPGLLHGFAIWRRHFRIASMDVFVWSSLDRLPPRITSQNQETARIKIIGFGPIKTIGFMTIKKDHSDHSNHWYRRIIRSSNTFKEWKEQFLARITNHNDSRTNHWIHGKGHWILLQTPLHRKYPTDDNENTIKRKLAISVRCSDGTSVDIVCLRDVRAQGVDTVRYVKSEGICKVAVKWP